MFCLYRMLRLIVWLLFLWAAKITLNVWWFIVDFLSELIKLWLLILFLWAICSAASWNRLPIILIIWIPIGWIIFIIYYLNKDKKTKKDGIKDSDVIEIMNKL